MTSLKDKLTSKIKVPKITATEWLQSRSQWPLLDVRSEGEFQEGHIPGSLSGPILNNEERHQVGIAYKKLGQEKAIELGLSLVESQKKIRIQSWLENLKDSVAVTCWRGGLRSRFASGWLEEEAGSRLNIVQITGGYKAIRRQLLNAILSPREMFILGGMTGSGKTLLLNELCQEESSLTPHIVDLEGLAKHRGSSFGSQISTDGVIIEQPRQQTFENALGIQLFQTPGPIVLENESTLIGKLFIPQLFRVQMKQAPLLILETPLEERIAFIFQEYVKNPLKSHCPLAKLTEILEKNLRALEKRLGGKETQVALKLFSEGMKDPMNLEKQSPWIELLLLKYYDKTYAYALSKSQQKIIFRGNKKEVKNWIREAISQRTIS